jgi:hypothetical protein
MAAQSDIFDMVRSFVAKFVLPSIVKSTAYGVLIGVLFFLAGLVVHIAGIAPLLLDLQFSLRSIVALLVVAVYTALGLPAGLVLDGSSSDSSETGRR